MRQQTEAQSQRDLFTFLRYWAYREPRFRYIFAIPNGGKRDGATAAQMYLTGTLAGVWDICCPFFGPWMNDGTYAPYGALYIEMKSATGRLTAAQEAFRAALQEEAAFVVCRSWVDAAQVICRYMNVQDEAILAALAINERAARQPRRPAAAAKGTKP